MIRFIVFALVAFIVLGLAIMWVASGGVGRAYSALRAASDVSTSTERFSLPWQPQVIFPGFIAPGLEGAGTYSPEDELARLEEEYEQLSEKARNAKTYGDPSPSFGMVRIAPSAYDAQRTHPGEEYVTLEAPYANTAPISLLGWSLQSVVTGVRVPIPPAVNRFRVGVVNAADPLVLNPGHNAIVLSGFSPVGTSFRVNRCTGYLAQFQEFTPSLPLSCPTGSDELPLTAENLSVYGDLCIDEARDVPTCTYPQTIQRPVAPACRNFLLSTLSYNGCLNRHERERDFFSDSWRVFLDSPRELWLNTHDALRLLDSEGRTVDVYVY